ncbi:hypothetical protein Pst134EA_009419 [Puccinia striiformis f. sp. tritici]|uniref:Hydrophobin n=1 Tax=Puccinia striiformis f. sp. tritici PST-78 TaxID=1165861 RepID=A0A0L0UQY8_9BASI|nr:hypothetical protein Pst134EA_009419 [Puccinia striiformis f. sp. tritici]KAH9458181.1 hypothetical protein Pst134EB_010483 [Puccinia striiformis f. sp. tritici]KAH9468890.1 hypothetical protein Pst134EA_009419 [Puccinia striiformis f. sp. tritici]KAI9622909.1 hypothetical protein H4Q26_014848 [Puccinia striiformis f. sp. tritici PST-130]KNE89487.1 hypothetical protein PSTG_17061 [Puccinia striiformis f. sp. tritici PST-78]
MLRFCRLIALVLLMTSWVAADTYDPKTRTTYFGCHKNVDAVCSDPESTGKLQTLRWAIRLHPGKRDYACPSATHPQCCDKGRYQDIDKVGGVIVKSGAVQYCHAGGQ